MIGTERSPRKKKVHGLPGTGRSWAVSGSRRSAGSRSGGDGGPPRDRHPLNGSAGALTNPPLKVNKSQLTIVSGPNGNENPSALVDGMDSVDCVSTSTSVSLIADKSGGCGTDQLETPRARPAPSAGRLRKRRCSSAPCPTQPQPSPRESRCRQKWLEDRRQMRKNNGKRPQH